MKSIKNNLFNKFSDDIIVKESLKLIEGGMPGPGSDNTGDTDCTNRGGSGADCGDSDTNAIYDTDPTSSGDDSCNISYGMDGLMGKKELF